MKVLMIGPARSVNGGISAVVNNYYKAGLDAKVQLEYIGTMEDGSKLHKLKIAILALMNYIRQISKYDIVHIHMASDASLYRKLPFICIAKMFRKKLIIQQHGGNIKHFYYEECGPERRDFIQSILNKADIFVVVAPYLKDIFQEIIEEDKIMILPNAIEIPKNVEKDYTKQDVLFLGRLCKEKGICELLDAIEELKNEFPKLNLYLGGVWVDEELREKALKMEEYVHYLGWIDSKQKETYLKKANLFVLPTYFEGLPMSLLEGMAYGCACVASAVGGIPQVMSDGIDGRLIQPQDVEGLKNAIRELLNSQEKQSFFGRNAIEHIRTQYDIEMSVQRLLEIYMEM